MKIFQKKHIKIIAAIVLPILLIAIYAVSVNCYVKYSQDEKILSADKVTGQYDCIIVLGCGVRDDGTPSKMLTDRLIAGIDMYNRGAAPVIIMSGDHGSDDYDEVNAMKRFALESGVPSDNIFLDHAGFNTYDSMYRAKAIFGVKTAVIVTQEYHLYRALYNAEAFGIDAVGVSATLQDYEYQFPRDIREIVARNKDFLWCIFKPEPSALGELIDLNGDGSVTH